MTLTPEQNAYGTSMITVFVTDGIATSQDTFMLTVTPVNDAPTISTISKTFDEDTVLSLQSTDFTSQYTDIDGDSLQYVRFVTLPDIAEGELQLSGVMITGGQQIASSDLGSITFVPASNFYGAIAFTRQANDGTDRSGL